MSQNLDGLNLVELLDLLKPMPEPAPISMVPQTAGWAVLAGVLTLVLIWAGLRVWRGYRANAYRRAALAELDMLTQSGQDPAKIAVLLKRTALAAYPRAQVAQLHGASWLEFLDAQLPGAGFSQGAGQILATAPWRATPPDPALTALARDWIRHHKKREES
ncbi:DUF4381 domain-containing protein [Pseudophaeobacter sp.]|uniref:DUF4381 domain-containing protein n=1 Tax=Pseudophaeobacter sp. TaxID=1971739 RepID=UPI00329696B9